MTIMNTGGLLGVGRSGGKWRSWGDSKLIQIFQVSGVDCYYSKRCALALPPGGHCPEDATFKDLVLMFYRDSEVDCITWVTEGRSRSIKPGERG